MTIGKEGQGPARGFRGTPGFHERAREATRKTFERKKRETAEKAERIAGR